MQREAQSYHLKFDKDREKLEKYQAEMTDGQDPQIMQLYFNVLDYLQDENRFYNSHALSNDFASYIA